MRSCTVAMPKVRFFPFALGICSRIPAEKYAGMKRTTWGDFLAFMHGEHPNVENLSDVTDAHAQEYIAILQKTERYDKNHQQTDMRCFIGANCTPASNRLC